jgi:hypothetical protein
MKNAPLNSARRRACGNGDNAAALPPVPQGNKTTRSGQTTCYQNRTTSFAIDMKSRPRFASSCASIQKQLAL